MECGWLVYGVLCHFQQYFSVILAVSFIGGGKWSTRRKPSTCRKSLTNGITLCCIEYTSAWTGFELTTLVGISTDYKGSSKSNYHAPTTTPDGIWGLLSCFLYLISITLGKHFKEEERAYIFWKKQVSVVYMPHADVTRMSLHRNGKFTMGKLKWSLLS